MYKIILLIVFAIVLIGCNRDIATQPTEYIYGSDTCETSGISCDISVKWCKYNNVVELYLQPFTGFQQTKDTFKIHLSSELRPIADEYFIWYHGNAIFNDNAWIENPTFKISTDGTMFVTGNFNNDVLTYTHQQLCFVYEVSK